MAEELPPDLDIYNFLNLEPSATDAEIRRTYRQLSLRWHPDKSNDPADHEKFHYLKLAVDLLSSPAARVAYDNVRRAKAAKAERTAKYDDDRRRMQRDLENRERDAKRRKFEFGYAQTASTADQDERELQLALEKLKKESERLVRERKKKLEDKFAKEEAVDDDDDDVADEAARTVKVRFRKGMDRTAEMVEKIFSQYGEVENVILGKSALVVFAAVSAAKAAVSNAKSQPGLEAIKDVAMVQISTNGSTDEKKDTVDESQKPPVPPVTAPTHIPPAPPKFSFKPAASSGNGADYESITLLRMRNLEKAKLEREIREQEEKEEETEAAVHLERLYPHGSGRVNLE